RGLLIKVALGAAALVGLAAIGSGRLLTWVPPARGDVVVPAPLPAAASASASASASAVPDDAGAAPDASAGPAVTADGKVAINRATEADLRRLPGVGPTRA